MDLSGPLWEGVLPGVLRRIYVGRRTGLLTLAREAERRRLRFHVGNIANAETNVQEDRLGDLLVRHRILADADLKRATGVVLREGKKLGKILVELNLISPEGLRDALAAHVDVVLSKVFTWADGHYEFRDEIGRVHDVDEMTLPVSTGDLILRASRSVSDPDVVRYHLGDIDRVVALSRDPLLRFQRLNLAPIDGFVLSRIDGALTARKLVELVRMPADEVRTSLFALLNTGVIEYMAKVNDAVTVVADRPAPPQARPPAAAGDATLATPAFAAVTAGDLPAAPSPEAASPAPEAASPAVPVETPPVEAPAPPSAELAAPAEPAAAAGPEPGSPLPAEPAPYVAAAADPCEATIVIDSPFSPGEPEYSTSPFGEPAIVLKRQTPDEPTSEEPIVWLPLPDIDVALENPPVAADTPSPASAPAARESLETRRGEILELQRTLDSRTHYELLGVERNASDASVREAYFRRAKRYHPDGHHDPGLADLREALESIFVRLGESYEVLRSPRLRARYDRRLAGLAAAEGVAADASPVHEPKGEEIHKAIVLAASFVARERYWEALPLLESAVPRATGEIKQRGRILLARIYARDPDWVKQAEELLLAVVQQQPNNAEPHFYLGVIYRHLGLRSRALASFRKVVELEPASDDAWQHIAQLDRQARLPVHIKKLARRS